MNQTEQSEKPVVAAGVPPQTHDVWRRRLLERYAAHVVHAPPAQPSEPVSDADKYRWIRAHRGAFTIIDALNWSDRDADFDAQIEAAMRMSAAGRHYYSSFGDLLR